MADDIVTRLRKVSRVEHDNKESGRWDLGDWILDAVDEIERLQAEVEILTKALRLVCDDASDFQVNDQTTFDQHISQVMSEYIDEARRGDR